MLIGCPLGPRTQPYRSAFRNSFTIINFMNFHSAFHLVFHLAFHLASQLNVALKTSIINDDVKKVNINHFEQFSNVSEFEKLDNLIDLEDKEDDTDLFTPLHNHLNGSPVY